MIKTSCRGAAVRYFSVSFSENSAIPMRLRVPFSGSRLKTKASLFVMNAASHGNCGSMSNSIVAGIIRDEVDRLDVESRHINFLRPKDFGGFRESCSCLSVALPVVSDHIVASTW
jgi:hypothetical protein